MSLDPWPIFYSELHQPTCTSVRCVLEPDTFLPLLSVQGSSIFKDPHPCNLPLGSRGTWKWCPSRKVCAYTTAGPPLDCASPYTATLPHSMSKVNTACHALYHGHPPLPVCQFSRRTVQDNDIAREAGSHSTIIMSR